MSQARQRNATIDEMVQDLENGIGPIYRREPMSVQRYMELYGHVYNLYAAPSLGWGRTIPQPDSDPGPALYKKLSAFIKNHAEIILKECRHRSGEDLLRYFTSQWDQFRFSSKVVGGIYSYLDRQWIKRETSSGSYEVHNIYTLALVTWKETFRKFMSTSITTGVLDLIERERQGIMIDSLLITGVRDCYVELGIDEVARRYTPSTVNPKLRVYKEIFEDKFIIATENFYTNEAATFLQENSVYEYMKRVERRLNEEKTRCETYLHSSSLSSLIHKCEEVLISQKLEFFQTEFCSLLEEHRDEDVARIYALCERVEGGLDELRKALEMHIQRQGENALEKVKEQANTDPKCFVHTVLGVYTRYSKLVDVAFKKELGFAQALDKATAKFVNKNCITQVGKVCNSKCPEMLAMYCDSILRKKMKKNNENVDIEELLDNVMTIFKFLEDKDVFQQFYTKRLANRLVGSLSASDEAEQSMVEKIKKVSGSSDYTNTMHIMLTNIDVSKEMTQEFREKCVVSRKSLGCDFSVKVLRTSAWPNLGWSVPHNLPFSLSSCLSEFSEYYKERYKERKLTWIFAHSKGEIVAHGFSKKFKIYASTPQMAILLLFNEATEMDVNVMIEALQTKKEYLIFHLGYLVKAEILKVKEGDESNLNEKTKIALNLEYTNKKSVVDLTKFSVRNEAKKEEVEDLKELDKKRMYIIRAAIVCIMKTRKQMSHTLLITEVVDHLKEQFNPKIQMVKGCIEYLIEREYLARVEGEKDKYDYVA